MKVLLVFPIPGVFSYFSSFMMSPIHNSFNPATDTLGIGNQYNQVQSSNPFSYGNVYGYNSASRRNPYSSYQPSYVSNNPMSNQAYGSFNMLSPLGGSSNAYDIFSMKKELCCDGSKQKRIACGQSLYGTSRHNCKRVGCCFDESDYACFKSQPKNCQMTEEQKKIVMEGIEKHQTSLGQHSTALPFIEKMQEDREKRNKIQEEKDEQKDRRVLDQNGEETAERTTDIAPVQQKYRKLENEGFEHDFIFYLNIFSIFRIFTTSLVEKD